MINFEIHAVESKRRKHSLNLHLNKGTKSGIYFFHII